MADLLASCSALGEQIHALNDQVQSGLQPIRASVGRLESNIGDKISLQQTSTANKDNALEQCRCSTHSCPRAASAQPQLQGYCCSSCKQHDRYPLPASLQPKQHSARCRNDIITWVEDWFGQPRTHWGFLMRIGTDRFIGQIRIRRPWEEDRSHTVGFWQKDEGTLAWSTM